MNCPSHSMLLPEVVRVLHAARTDEVVVTTMGSAREWMLRGTHPLDFIYAPSAMGEAPALGLGLAIAQPRRRIVVCNGDGCMLMNLGSLVTIAAQAPPNLVLLIFENGVYEVTGAQPTAATQAPQQSPVNFATLARGAGFATVFEFDDLQEWEQQVSQVLSMPGPVLAVLKVAPVPEGGVPHSPAPPASRATALKQALGEG